MLLGFVFILGMPAFFVEANVAHKTSKRFSPDKKSRRKQIDPSLLRVIINRKDPYFIRVGRLMMANSRQFRNRFNGSKSARMKKLDVPLLIKVAENFGRLLDDHIKKSKPLSENDLLVLLLRIEREGLFKEAASEIVARDLNSFEKEMIENTVFETWRFGPYLKELWRSSLNKKNSR